MLALMLIVTGCSERTDNIIKFEGKVFIQVDSNLNDNKGSSVKGQSILYFHEDSTASIYYRDLGIGLNELYRSNDDSITLGDKAYKMELSKNGLGLKSITGQNDFKYISLDVQSGENNFKEINDDVLLILSHRSSYLTLQTIKFKEAIKNKENNLFAILTFKNDPETTEIYNLSVSYLSDSIIIVDIGFATIVLFKNKTDDIFYVAGGYLLDDVIEEIGLTDEINFKPATLSLKEFSSSELYSYSDFSEMLPWSDEIKMNGDIISDDVFKFTDKIKPSIKMSSQSGITVYYNDFLSNQFPTVYVDNDSSMFIGVNENDMIKIVTNESNNQISVPLEFSFDAQSSITTFITPIKLELIK